ncbi:MAG: CRISPR-associated endonuclease Cas6, partial [Ferruginibacter sp.]
MHTIQTLTAIFDIPLSEHEAVDFKKPVCAAIHDLRENGQTDSIATDLFYNRDEETGNAENRYPLIQYKSIRGKAAITGINEGAQALQSILKLLRQDENTHLNKRFLFNKQNPVDFSQYQLHPSTHQLQLLTRKKQYLIKEWLPLDTHRYKAWMASQELKMLAEILDECLPRQISKMLSSVGFHHTVPFIAHTTSILATKDEVQIYHEKKIPFDCIISCNIDLPNDIGIGQVPGIGYGRIFKTNSTV